MTWFCVNIDSQVSTLVYINCKILLLIFIDVILKYLSCLDIRHIYILRCNDNNICFRVNIDIQVSTLLYDNGKKLLLIFNFELFKMAKLLVMKHMTY